MRHTRPCLAVFEPLLNSLVLFPCVVSGERLDARHAWIVEDLILLLEDLQSLLGCLVFLNVSVHLLQEGLLSDDILVLLDDVCVSSRQTLDLN
jgi:hypothetical protein